MRMRRGFQAQPAQDENWLRLKTKGRPCAVLVFRKVARKMMMPGVTGNLMPHMIREVVPLVTGPMIDYLSGKN
jgi:hypothetical protein